MGKETPTRLPVTSTFLIFLMEHVQLNMRTPLGLIFSLCSLGSQASCGITIDIPGLRTMAKKINP